MRSVSRLVAALIIAGLGIALPNGTSAASLAARARVQLVPENIEQPTVLTLDPYGNVYAVVYGFCGLYDSIVKLAPNGTIVRHFELTYGTAPGQFKTITGLAVDAAGNMYVADFLNSRIQKLSPSGVPLAVWRGSQGGGSGIWYPQALTMDRQGHLYIVDSGASRVLKLGRDGTVLAALSTGYSPEFSFDPAAAAEELPDQLGEDITLSLAGVAVDRTGNIYVATGVDLRKLSPTGAPLAVWKPPAGRGYVQHPWQIAVDPAGNIYSSGVPAPVHERGYGIVEVEIVVGLNTIDKLSPRGTLLARWAIPGKAPGRFEEPIGLATDGAGSLYVADRANDRIETLSAHGDPGAIWGDTRIAPTPRGRLGDELEPIAVGAKGNLWISAVRFSPGKRFSPWILQLSPTGRIIARWAPVARGADRTASGLTADHQGNIYLADRADTGVIELSSSGRSLHRWVMPRYRSFASSRPGLPDAPTVDDIAVAPWGSIYATADDSLWTASRSSRTFRMLVLGSSNVPARYSLSVVATDRQRRRIYAIDQLRRIDLFSTTGRQLGRRQPREACAGIVFNPVAIAVGPRGTLYVADGDPIDQILKFSPGGRLLARWGSRGHGPDQFKFFFTAGLAVGPRGNVFVTDISGRLRKFSPSGRLLASWR